MSALLFPVICHVVGITYQTIEHRLLAEMLGDPLGKTPTHTPSSELTHGT